MRLRLMDFVVLPAKTLKMLSAFLSSGSHSKGSDLCDAHRPPFLLPQELQCALGLVVVLGGNNLEHRLRELHVPILELTVGIAATYQQARSWGRCAAQNTGWSSE
jgi:hypothetical protein